MSNNLRLSFEERQRIEALVKEGLSLCEIAKSIGRSKNSVVTDVRKNGGRENYTAEKSWQSKEERHAKHIEALRAMRKGKPLPPSRLDLRISALEMQVAILIEHMIGGKS